MRRRRPRPHVSHDRWLVSYADFVTLLFAFFVVLYASSQVDQRKVGRLALAIQVAFQELGVFSASATAVPAQDAEAMPASSVQLLDNVAHTAALGRIVPPAQGDIGSSEDADLSALREELQTALAAEIQRSDISLHVEPEGLVISLREIGFFDTASATIRPQAQGALDQITVILRRYPHALRVEGHTDNVPIHTAQFGSNWELSTARATEVLRLLIVRYGFTADRLAVAGYAEFHPVASNLTPEGRALNRRVDVVVIRHRSLPTFVTPAFTLPQ
jgi:chemotaxis protein MotB